MLSYAVKRVMRSLGLFAALLLGVVLASSFFAGVNIGADTTAKAALNQQLSRVPFDIVIEQYGSTSKSAVWAKAVTEVAQVDDIIGAEVISRVYWYGNTTFLNETFFTIVGLSDASRAYEGLTITSGAGSLGTNETYVWTGSKDADKIKLNSTFTLNFTYEFGIPPTERTLSLTLKVVGFVDLDDTAYSIVAGQWYWVRLDQATQVQTQPSPSIYDHNLLIVKWEEIAKLLDTIPSNVPSYVIPFSTQILAYIDRDALINPWDISVSLEAVRTVTARVNQAVAKYSMGATNNLENTLMMYQFTSLAMRFSFFIVALPVFFVAWYVGTTASDVSYNLRRREIGLLLTKGFSNRQIFRVFLTESVIIGIIGGLVGVGLGFILSPFFATIVGGELGTAPLLNQEVIIMTIIFSLAITLLSTFRPSRKASKLSAADALKEYMYVEEVKPYKQRLPWLAFALGLYKIVMFLLGINLAQMFSGRPPPFANIFLLILLSVWIIIDSILAYIGPLLFFWGFTKIFIRGSLKFQELVTRVAKFLGDLGTLATKNVRRNPVRAASGAFLIALIVGYGFQTIGSVASEQDYIIRNIKTNVGADISVELTSTTNIFQVANATEKLLGVDSATVEYSLSGTLPQFLLNQIRAVDPNKWLSTAYYENEWFSGSDVATMFQKMATNNRTIILERNLAKTLGKNVGDNVTLTIGDSTLQLTIVGLFGPETAQGALWSYVPIGLCELLGFESSTLRQYTSARVLVKLKPNADGKLVTSEIRNLEDVSYVRSVAEELETYQSNISLIGSLNIQRIGVIFSILAASVATSLATFVSLQERKREVSIMNARGLSFKQLVTMLLTENLSIVVFSAALGIVVGLIVVRGNVAASNAMLAYSLVAHRIVFPLDAIILLSTCLILVFASTIIPVILLTKKYISKVERIVRF